MNRLHKLNVVSTLLLLACSFFSAHLWAGINIKAGPMLSKLEIDQYDGYRGTPPKSLPGFRAGISYSIRLLKNSWLEPGVDFTNEAVNYYEYEFKDHVDLRVNLLKFNLLLNLQMSPSQFHVIAGPYMALRAGKEKNKTIGFERFDAESEPEFGVLLGLRFYFKKSGGKNSGLFLEVLGDIGFTKFFNGWDARYSSYRSKNISLMLGYDF